MRILLSITLLALTVFLFAAQSNAASTEYQVTGPVLENTDAAITVQKGKERWEIAKTPATKLPGNVKAGDKVTVHYTMTATSVESKSEKGGKKGK